MKALRKKVIEEIVHPAYFQDAQDSSLWRFRWRTISSVSLGTAKILGGCASILAFSSGFFAIPSLSYISGCCSTVGLVFFSFSNFATAESKERTADLATTLHALELKPMPFLRERSPSPDPSPSP